MRDIEQWRGHLQHHGHGAGVQQSHAVGGQRRARLPGPQGLGLQGHVKAALPTAGGGGQGEGSVGTNGETT